MGNPYSCNLTLRLLFQGCIVNILLQFNSKVWKNIKLCAYEKCTDVIYLSSVLPLHWSTSRLSKIIMKPWHQFTKFNIAFQLLNEIINVPLYPSLSSWTHECCSTAKYKLMTSLFFWEIGYILGYMNLYNTVEISVCSFVCLIITQEPHDRFASSFDWGTR